MMFDSAIFMVVILNVFSDSTGHGIMGWFYGSVLL